MRVLYDPMTIATVAITAVSGVFSGMSAKAQAKAEADYYKQQAAQEQLAQMRDLEALETERARTMARSRAVLAAQGGGLEGTGESLLEGAASTFGRREAELIHDSEARIRSLSARAASAKAAGNAAMWGSIFSGLGSAGKAGATLFRSSPTVPKTSSGSAAP